MESRTITKLNRAGKIAGDVRKGTMRGIGKSLLLLAPAAMWGLDPSLVMAQPSPRPTSAVTQPATTQPATRPTTQAGAVSRPATQISMQFRDAPVDAVLEHLSAVAGFVVVKEGSIDGRVTVFSQTPVSPTEAVTLLNTVLKEKGYAAIQQERILKIMPRDKVKKVTPVFFGADPAQIPMTDNLVTQIIPVKTVDVVKLKQDLTPLLSTDADVTSNGASNNLIVTDTQANIHRIVEIIAGLDKRDPADNGIRVKQLKYADATATAKLIQDIFKADSTADSNVPPQAAFFRAMRGGPGGFPGMGGGGAAGADSTDKARIGKIIASADQRTNTVVITGPTDTLKIIDTVLEQLDANPASEQTFFIYSLKNAQAVNLQGVLNNLFGGSGNSNSGSRSSTGNNTGNRAQFGSNSNSNSSFGGGGGGNFGGGGGGGRNAGGGTGGFGGGGGGNTGTGGGNSRANNTGGNNGNRGGQLGGSTGGGTSDLTGQVYVVADQDTNSLLVATATKYQEHVKEVIATLDRPVAQVLIKVLIAEVTHDNSEDLGVDFSILNRRGTAAGSPGQTFGTNFGTAAATGGLVVNLLESNVNVTLRALAQAGKLDVLSRPYILASDNQLASITVGSEVPFVTNTRIDSLGGQTNTIQYQDIGIILNVTPHINPDGLVILDVAPEISSLTQSSVTISNGVTAPIYAKRSANSRVGIMNGQTIVIGGLMEDRKDSKVQKIPILGDIPLLGPLFQRNQVTKTKTELLIFLTPHVAQMPDVLKPMSQDELKGTKLTPGAVEPGVFDDHIRGMQRGATTITPHDPATEWKPSTPADPKKPKSPVDPARGPERRSKSESESEPNQ